MHDTRLEDSLRRALHEEADALPFTITADDLNVRLAQRPRQVSRLGMLSAAAAVVVVVGAGAFLANQGPNSSVGNSPQPSATFPADLETYEALHRSIGEQTTILLQGERIGVATGDDNLVTHNIGSVAEPGFHGIIWDCSGPGPFSIGWREQGGVVRSSSMETPSCDGPGEIFSSPEKPTNAVLFVSASPATSWRVMAYTPRPDSLSTISPADAGWTWTPSIDEATEFDVPQPVATGDRNSRQVGQLPPGLIYQFAYICLGPGDIELSIGEPGSPQHEIGTTRECDGAPN
jgi:hypothetical protein